MSVQRAQTISPRTIPRLLSTTFYSILINYIIKLGHPVPELNFVLDENKGNLQAAQNSFYGCH
jgi:hypothetical protein